jgi:hypothetical protein
MTSFSYYFFDVGSQLVDNETAEHDDILDAFERMQALLDERAAVAMVQLWQAENFVAHINRRDRRLILKSKTEPLPLHPLVTQDPPETKAG